jgi:hypothetical protein
MPERGADLIVLTPAGMPASAIIASAGKCAAGRLHISRTSVRRFLGQREPRPAKRIS